MTFLSSSQREKLEDTFTDLFKDAPGELQAALSRDLEDGENRAGAERGADGGADDHIVLDEYLSEDEVTKGAGESDEEDKEDDNTYVTKVSL